jgi:hypothetical protein
MTEDERARIVAESFETLERLEQREREQQTLSTMDNVSGGHFDPVRARRTREPEPEPEVRYTDPIRTVPMPAPAAEPPVIGEDFLSELIATVIADVTAEYDRKLDELRAEVRELKSDRSYAAFAAKLDQSIRTMDALAARFDRGHGQVVDLPSWPRRAGDVN